MRKLLSDGENGLGSPAVFLLKTKGLADFGRGSEVGVVSSPGLVSITLCVGIKGDIDEGYDHFSGHFLPGGLEFASRGVSKKQIPFNFQVVQIEQFVEFLDFKIVSKFIEKWKLQHFEIGFDLLAHEGFVIIDKGVEASPLGDDWFILDGRQGRQKDQEGEENAENHNCARSFGVRFRETGGNRIEREATTDHFADSALHRPEAGKIGTLRRTAGFRANGFKHRQPVGNGQERRGSGSAHPVVPAVRRIVCGKPVGGRRRGVAGGNKTAKSAIISILSMFYRAGTTPVGESFPLLFERGVA